MRHLTPLLALTLALAVPSIARAQPAPAGVATTQGLADTIRAGHDVRRGDSGPAVRELQGHLVRHGHAVSVDGDFGGQTDTAVRAFQRAKGLGDDGLVGANTLRALEAPASSTGGGLVGGVGGAPAATRPPSSSTDPAQAHAAALPWARAAKAAGRHTLIIVFEGQFAYASGYASRIYAYQDALRRGEDPSRPLHTGLSFVSTGLIVPHIRETMGVAELLILPETSENPSVSIGSEVGRAWREVHGSDSKIVIVGHSLGGWSALQCGSKLNRFQVPVASVLTMDARTYTANYPYFIKSPNVTGPHKNYFQKSLVFPGYEIRGAENQRLHIDHARIPGAPEVVAAYLAMVR
jgi:peptidoglycan hydrolase-like protein with peptidoglycan-binding domain